MKRKIDFLIGVPLAFLHSLKRTRKNNWENGALPKKILLIKFAAVGDTILLVPALRGLRNSLPGAEIHWLVSDINVAIAETVPYVDRVISWNRRLGNLLHLIQQLRREKYDVVIDFEQWARMTSILAKLSGAPTRIGFNTPRQYRTRLFTKTLTKREDRHEVDEFLDLVGLLTPITNDRRLELWETETGLDLASHALGEGKSGGPIIIFHPGCGSDGLPREWPLENYAVVGHWLIKKAQAKIFITGGPDESKKTADLKKLLNGQAVDLGGKLSWPVTISVVKKAQLVLSGNTGIMHVAAALQTPQVALHGPTNPVLWGPLSRNAKIIQSSCPRCPCLKLGFEYHAYDRSCMSRIEVDSVKQSISTLLKQ